MFFIFIFQLYILKCLSSASQKSRNDSLFLNKCSTEKLYLLADVMLVSMIILRIMVRAVPFKSTWEGGKHHFLAHLAFVSFCHG